MNGNGVVGENFPTRSHVDVSLARTWTFFQIKYEKTLFSLNEEEMSEFVAQSKVFQSVWVGSFKKQVEFGGHVPVRLLF